MARVNLASIFDQVADACLVVDNAGRVTFINHAGARLIGPRASKLLGQPLPVDHANAAPIQAICSAVSKTRQPAHRRWLSPASQRWFELRATPAGDSVLLLCWESESQSAELARLPEERQPSQLNETIQELESLSYTISHDLRAPLRHVEAFAGLLAQNLAGKLDGASAEYLAVIGQSAGQMSKLLDAVLSYSRLCRRELHPARVDLDHALKAVLQELKLEMEGRKIDWRIEPLPEVQADPWMVRQALSRLISNALKFTRTRETARISISGAALFPEMSDGPGEGEVVLRIEDNGVGFDMVYIDRLFGLFQRLHSDPQFEGIGVGLAHVRRMILRQGGRVWAEAKLDSGATFFIALPRP